MHGERVPAVATQTVPFPAGVVITRDEAKALRQFLLGHSASQVTIATTDYYAGRASLSGRQQHRGTKADSRSAGAGGVSPNDWLWGGAGWRLYRLECLTCACAVARYR